MRKSKTAVYVVLVASAGLLAAAVSPLTVMVASISMIAFLAIAQQMNFQRMLTVMRNLAKNVKRLRFEVRARLHIGFRDYSDPFDAEGSSRSGRCSYAM